MRKTWTAKELVQIYQSAHRIMLGRTIYKEVKYLKTDIFPQRSWESIRSKLNRVRKELRLWQYQREKKYLRNV